jgi:uncharacterized membrane protein YgcG
MATADEIVQQFKQLPEPERAKAASEIQATQQLPPPPQPYVGILWLMVVGAFIVLLIGGTVLLYLLVRDGTGTEVIAPLVTGALGVLAGLLAPSPVSNTGGGG